MPSNPPPCYCQQGNSARNEAANHDHTYTMTDATTTKSYPLECYPIGSHMMACAKRLLATLTIILAGYDTAVTLGRTFKITQFT